jgi:hypothetical protein
VNLLENVIPLEQAKDLARIFKEHPTLKSLCGNSGDETELHMSGKKIGEGGAIMLAPEIAGNGAMTRLDFSKNRLRATGCKALAEALAGNQVMKELNVAGNELTLKADAQYMSDYDISGVTTLTDVISGMGALVKLDIGTNYIGAGQKLGLQRICVARGIDLAM